MTHPGSSLRNKKILLGITGSVAAYKALDLIRRLRDEEASVTAVMTDASKRFVTPHSVEVAAGGRVHTGLFEDPMAHVELARGTDLMLVAPATANTIGKFASGLASDLLSTCFLAFRGRVLLAPAMNWRMYGNPVLRANLERLRAAGVMEVTPGEGRLACGEEGPGRMADTDRIMEAARAALAPGDLEGRKIVVTAGPTREYLDDVRFITNRSSGKMGYALAKAASLRGAGVTLISGPAHLETPPGVSLIRAESAREMREAVLREINGSYALIMAAAVADFSPVDRAGGKLPKSAVKSLELEPAPDILGEVGSMEKRPLLVGFAAEAGDNVKRAEEKLGRKNVDIMVFNNISEPGAGFESDTNRVVIIERGRGIEYPLMSKEDVAAAILDRLSGFTT
jgi:phosphopantothenoylcysteine decarboxylase/phosphopantothenate--cysteine ligase